MKVDEDRFDPARILEDELDAGIEKGQLPQSMLEGRKIEFGLGEDLTGRHEGNLGAGPAERRSGRRERSLRLSIGEPHTPFLTVPANREIQPFRQGVDHTDTDAVQTAGNLVGVLVEFSRRHAGGS